MEDAPFPAWVRNSSVFAMARVLSRHLRQQMLVASAERITKTASLAFAAPVPLSFRPENTANCSMSLLLNKCVDREGLFSLGGPTATPSVPERDLKNSGSLRLKSGDILNHPHVALLIALSQVKEIISKRADVSVKNAPALVSLMAFAVECRTLPSGQTKCFYEECASLYITLMRCLRSITFLPCVNVGDFVASLVFCGLQLCHNGDNVKCYNTGEEEEEGDDENDVVFAGDHGEKQGKDKHVGLAGFNSRIIDSLIVSCIPSNLDDCVENSIALGALSGLAYTTKQDSLQLSPQLVNHLHDLTDAFSTSPRRKELVHKRLFCYLMEATCCARCVDYARVHNWFAAILQPEYLLKGLMRRENLHARVAAATLTLLEGWMQDTATKFVLEAKRAVVGTVSHDEMSNFATREEVVEIDLLIENIWSALQKTLNTLQLLQKDKITFYGDNVRIVLENLLRVELQRVQCYRVMSGVYQQPATVIPQQGNIPKESYVPSPEEEDLRLRVIGNILKFLLLPTSLFSVLISMATVVPIRDDIAEQCVKAVAITASTEGGVTSLWRNTPLSLSETKASFSHNYHSNIDGIIHELIVCVLKTDALGSSRSPTLGEEEVARGRVAALCLQGLCAASSHVRSFALTEVLDLVVRFPAASHVNNALSNSNANNNSATFFLINNTPLLSVCFEMINRVLVSRQRSIFKLPPYEAILGFGQILFDTFEDTLRNNVESGDLTNPSVDFPNPTLMMVAESFWGLVQRCHGRICVMTREGLRLVAQGRDEAQARLINALNEESRVLLALLRALLRCMINVAWPGSGILYSKKPRKGNFQHVSGSIAANALAILSLFFRPLCLLYQLSTLFPLTDVRLLLYHHENAHKLTQWEGSESFLHYYCFQPNNMRSPLYAENGMAQFRSFWLMLCYYRFANKALLLTDPNATVAALNRSRRQGNYILTGGQAKCIRLLAASAPPLIHMRSSDYQQAVADIEVLRRHLSSGGIACDSKAYKKVLIRSLRRCSSGVAHVGKCLSFSQAFLMDALATLEMLRASCGSISTITHYQQYEVREFDASSDIRTIVQHVTTAVTTRYLSALQGMPPDIAASRIDESARQLVLLYGFGIHSVRLSAKNILDKIILTFPTFAACSTALPFLWAVINLMEVGHAAEAEQFCEHMRSLGAPVVTTVPDSLERRMQLHDAVAFAEKWAEVARKGSPLALLGHATLFIFGEEQDMTSGLLSTAAGSRLAFFAHIMDGATAQLSQNYDQSFIKRSLAQGQLTAVFRFAPEFSVDTLLLQQLQAMVGDRHKAMTRVANSRRELLTSLIRTVHAITRVGERVHENNGNNDEDNQPQQRNGLQEQSSLHDGQAACQGLYQAEALLSTVAAFLLSARITSSLEVELLWYFVQGPIHLFTRHHIAAAIQGWKWLLFEKPERYAVSLLVQVVEGFIWSIERGIGLFDGARPSQTKEVESGVQAAPIQGTSVYPEDYNVNSPHKLLIEFISTCYVDVRGPVSFHPSVLLLLHHLAMRIVEAPSRFSTKDASFSEVVRCALMMNSICQNLQMANDCRLRIGSPPLVAFTSIGKLRQGWYRCLLQWFRKTPPSWYFTRDLSVAEDELEMLEKLMGALNENRAELERSVEGFLDFEPLESQNYSDLSRTLIGSAVRHIFSDRGGLTLVDPRGLSETFRCAVINEKNRLLDFIGLLRLLVEHECTRLMLWRRPREAKVLLRTGRCADLSEAAWRRHCEAAASNDPLVLMALVERFPNSHVLRCAMDIVSANPGAYSYIPEAVDLYLNDSVLKGGYPALCLFTNCTIVQALRFLDASYMARYPQVSGYALRSLLSQRSESLILYFPQILQVLSGDTTGGVASFLRRMCEKSDMFAHQLLWSLQTEGEGESELAKKCSQLASEVREGFDAKRRAFHDGEFSFIQKIISVSGELRPVEKAQRKKKLRLRLRDAEFQEPVGRLHLYLPTDTNWRIVGLIPHTAGAMQSAAKCPILVQFECVPRKPDETQIALSEGAKELLQERPGTTVKACIFKMGDDCRQDQIALQLISLFQRIFNAVQVPSYLYPYRVVTTGRDSGVIECVPRAMSRDQIGKLVESNLAEYFVQTYGHPESNTFRQARDCFIRSMASYAVTSFLLNIKDRHNGNIMIDAQGHLVHIDFGFLFDYSPGGDINFESSPFKLTAEMIQLMGHTVGRGGGTVQSHSLAEALEDPESYKKFKDLTIQCYLAVRQYSRQICALVELMLSSGLPCFKPRRTIQDLAWRLAMQKSEAEAAEFMRKRIAESKGNIRTFFYDKYQNCVEGIEM